MKIRTERTAGFTLVELIVAVGLFAVVMLISVTALLSLVTANRKAQALQSVINNLNITMDGIVRSIREGSGYRCGSQPATDPDCSSGAGSMVFTSRDGRTIAYAYETTSSGGRITKSENGSAAIPMTASEVDIESVTFYVIGARPVIQNGIPTNDYVQPKVLIVIKGTAGRAGSRAETTFHLQSTAVQRVLDI